MSRQLKEKVIQEYKSIFSGIDAFIVVGFTGTDAGEMTGIRRQLRQASVKMKIVKNSLAERAFKEQKLEQLQEVIDGPSALCFGGDIVKLAKVVTACARGAGKFKIRAGYYDRKVIPIGEVRSIAAIPSREMLYAQVAGVLGSPLTKLANLLYEMPARVARLLKALADKKQESEN